MVSFWTNDQKLHVVVRKFLSEFSRIFEKIRFFSFERGFACPGLFGFSKNGEISRFFENFSKFISETRCKSAVFQQGSGVKLETVFSNFENLVFREAVFSRSV